MLRRRTLLSGAALAPLTACAGKETVVRPERHAYGSHAAQWGALHRPRGASRGVVVVIHGGFWRQQYDASLGTPLAADLAERGWTAWNLEYRRVGGGGGVPPTLDDVAAGIDVLAELDVDTSTVITLGHSAGGHLAAWAASRHRFDRWEKGLRISRVVAQAGVLDLAGGVRVGLGSGAIQDFCGGSPATAPEAYLWADPTPQVPVEVPVHCVHAADDDTVPIAQSRRYVQRARAAGARADLTEVTGGHFGVIDVDSPAWAACVDALG